MGDKFQRGGVPVAFRKLLIILALALCGLHRAQAQTIDEVYKKALTEGGTLNFYGTLA